jgi:molybdopterin synthase catalytic subunit
MADSLDIIRLTRAPLSLDDLVREMGHASTLEDGPGKDAEAGALVTFSGIVRATEGERQVPHLDYEAFESMALREMQRLVEAARQRWPLRRVALVHRFGLVAVGEPSVIVAVSAGHRAEAFDAARFLIDDLKKSVPIWKSEPR